MHLSRTTFCCLVGACLAVGTAPAKADWTVRLPNGDELKPLQLFQVYTEGDRRRPPWVTDAEMPRVPKIKEFGTGFAVAPNVIITARHVTHDADEFASLVDKVPVPDRTITVSYPENTDIDAVEKKIDDLWVTPAAVSITDAVKLSLVAHTVTPFQLSMCEIKPGAAFHLLKFRQNAEGGGKNLRVPVLIPVTADLDPTERLGELRRFKHKTTDDEERPIPGDSGSPILDGNGRVVGLLTAIKGDNLLYVTPANSFVELIPEERRKTIECYNAVTQEQIDTLQEQITALNDVVSALKDENEKLVTKVDFNASLVQSAVTQMLIEAKERGEISGEALLSALENVKDLDPVIPVVNSVRVNVANMTRDLSELKWGFRISSGANPTLNVKYQRGISMPLFAEKLTLCYRPIVDFKPDARPKDHKELNYQSFNFYEWSEEKVITGELMTDCVPVGRPQRKTKSETYGFSIDAPVFSRGDYPMLDFDSWDGRYYAYTVFENVNPQTEELEAKILHRFVLKVSPSGNIQKRECYHIPVPESGIAEFEMVNFFVNTSEQERGKFECRDL